MARIHWSKEQKQEFWMAFVRHRDEGCKIREAYRRACTDFQTGGKKAPGWFTFANWYQKAMNGFHGPMDADSANNKTHRSHKPHGQAAEAEAEEVSAESAAPEAEEAAASDYTRRLELMCRLYRSRTEYDVDAMCDYLLPDLCAREAASEQEEED